MSHEIYEERFLARGTPGWHNLGTVFAQDRVLSTIEAFREAKMDTTLSKLPLYADAPDGQGGTVRMLIPDRVALVRDADQYGMPPHYIGDVHPKYPVLQNMEVAEFLRPFSDTARGGWPVETVGLLKQGELLFVTLRAGGAGVGPQGDPTDNFFLFTDHRDGQHPAEVAQVTLRVVCANTLHWALSSSPNRVSVRHTRDFRDKVEFYTTTMARLRGLNVEATAWWNRFAATPLTQEQITALFADLWALPAKPEQHALLSAAQAAGHAGRDVERQVEAFKVRVEAWEKETDRVQRIRADVQRLYGELTDEFAVAGAAGTAWHAYNTVSQWAGTYKGREVARSLLFGERGETVQRAFGLLVPAARDTSYPSDWDGRVMLTVPSIPAPAPVAQPRVQAAPQPAPAPIAQAVAAPVATPVQRTPEEKAANAAAYIHEQQRNLGRTFTSADVTPLLRRAATSWLRGTTAPGLSPFLQDMRAIVLAGRDLTDAQVKGTLNCCVYIR